jgi:hypothetical protein
MDGLREFQSPLSIEQPPGHGSDLVENRQHFLGLYEIDRSSLGKKPHMAVDFLGRSVGNPPVVKSISAGSAMTLGEIGWNRTR